MAIKRGGRVGEMAGNATEVASKARWDYGQQGLRQGHFDGKKEPYWPCPPLWRWDGTEGVHWNEFQKTASPHLIVDSR